VVERRGSGARTARYLSGKGFGDDVVGAVAGRSSDELGWPCFHPTFLLLVTRFLNPVTSTDTLDDRTDRPLARPRRGGTAWA